MKISKETSKHKAKIDKEVKKRQDGQDIRKQGKIGPKPIDIFLIGRL